MRATQIWKQTTTTTTKKNKKKTKKRATREAKYNIYSEHNKISIKSNDQS